MKPEKKAWIVRLRCTVEKEIYLQGCTEDEARSNPWHYVHGEELELGMSDWDVLSIKPND